MSDLQSVLNQAVEANTIGLNLFQKGQFVAAEASLRRAISLVPAGAYPEARNNLGIVLQTTARLVEATAEYREALRITPTFGRPACNIGSIAEEVGRFAEAEKLYRYALKVDPEVAAIWHNLAGIYREWHRFDDAYACYDRALAIEDNDGMRASLIYTRDMDPRTTREQSAAFKIEYAQKHGYGGKRPVPANPDPERKLRVGYVSGDFRLHSVSFAFANVLFGHDRRKFEVFCYSTTQREDMATTRFEHAVDKFTRAIGLDDTALAQLIRDDKIDILVDLSGYTAGHRLRMFTHYPAPVQVHAWGYLNGTGLPEIPHTILDDVLEPGNAAQLPCVFHYRPPVAPDVGPLPFSKNGYVTFGYIGRWSKVTADVAVVWRELLASIPRSRLVIKDKTFADQSRKRAAEEMLGIPQDRIIFLPHSSHYAHLSDHNLIDIGLDPWPTNGGISSIDALWMGVPIITLPGDRPSARVGASIMTTIGLPDFIAQSTPEYVEIGKKFAFDMPTIARIRSQLRGLIGQTVIGNAGLYIAHLERLYRQMWRQACAEALT